MLTWYATAVAWSDPWMQGISRVFRKAGFPVFDRMSPPVWRIVKLALLAASVALLFGYAALAWKRWRREGIATPSKHWLHAIAFSVIIFSYQFPSWYRAQSVQNLFHALQYFFMVWIYGNLPIRRDPAKPAVFYRALFGRGSGVPVFAASIAFYGALAMALSSSGYRSTGVDAERQAQIIGSIGLASLLLHFYVDSFIWKVRSRPVRTALGIGGQTAQSEPSLAQLREPAWRGALHGVAYFGIPVALVALLGARARDVSPQKELASLAREAAVFPRSAMAHALYGPEALTVRDPATARRELATSLDLAPTLEGPALMLAGLDRLEGRSAEELEHARLAVRDRSTGPEARYALGNALASAGRSEEAEEQYRAALRLKPNFAGAEENLGVLYKWRGRLDLAIPHFRRALGLDPNLSSAACDLAGALATLGQTDEALATLRDFRRLHPDDRPAADLERLIASAAPPENRRR